MEMKVLMTIEVDVKAFAKKLGIPESEVDENLPKEFVSINDCESYYVRDASLYPLERDGVADVVQPILARPRNGDGGGIPLTRGEVAMLFLDGYAGDGPGLLDVRSQGYGEDDEWDGLTPNDVLEDENTAFVWSKWEPLELWP